MFRFPPLTPFTKKLLIALSATFVTALLLTRIGGLPVVELLALLPTPGIHTAWQIFTYPLVGVPSSGGVIGLLISVVFLWLMLAPYEARFGARAAFQLCVIATLASAIVFVPFALVLPARPLVGPSPLFLGVIGAMAASVPNDARLSFFGVLPMTPRMMVIIFLAFTALMNVADGNFAAVPADAAAIGAGILFHRNWLMRPARPRKPPGPEKKPRRKNHGFKVIHGGGDDDDDRPRYLN